MVNLFLLPSKFSSLFYQLFLTMFAMAKGASRVSLVLAFFILIQFVSCNWQFKVMLLGRIFYIVE